MSEKPKPLNDTSMFETSEFKALQKEWYGKLDVDFVDIEKNEREYLIQPQVFYVHGCEIDYHQLCESILREFHFRRPLDRKIFELHTEGKSSYLIEEHLKTHSIRKLKARAIDYLIKRIKEQFLKGTT